MDRQLRIKTAVDYLKKDGHDVKKVFGEDYTPLYGRKKIAGALGYRGVHQSSISVIEEMVELGLLTQTSSSYRGISGKRYMYCLPEFDTRMEFSSWTL